MKNLYYKIGAGISVLPVLLMPTATYAQLSESLGNLTEVGTASGQASGAQAELPQLIGALIQVLLSVLGIIFVVLIIYAGFLYMTASGEKDKVDKAKSLMIQAIIGIVIIVAAYAISTFIMTALVGVTT